jgi:hypothetical protein
MSGMSGGGMGSAAGMFEDERKVNMPRPEPESDYGSMRKAAPPKGKGMVLGSKGKQSNDVLKAIQAEDALAGLSAPPPASKARDDRKQSQPAASNERSAHPARPPANRASYGVRRAHRGRVMVWGRGGLSVSLKVEEKIVVRVAQDGTLEVSHTSPLPLAHPAHHRPWLRHPTFTHCVPPLLVIFSPILPSYLHLFASQSTSLPSAELQGDAAAGCRCAWAARAAVRDSWPCCSWAGASVCRGWR